ncbi:ABC transporter ATP-binding protein [Telluria mixta]|uniref:ABC transporter ATP-binding protein n=1 Tax=Telluria mixta TaxID=34071 RepID=A0ABT2BZ81_9BURK|nr:ABC transporter ATP-binding protein [Telluria mixta]MCS0630366.1 ABC transporter ATP-binding protein [Telluria mixta]WEM94327.1 ABC transporter ATP-binding protein [Telluria mixta]
MAGLSATVLLSARDLVSPFGGPFTFDVHAGECIAIQGPSGAGKSVLLRMLADLDPHDGDALLDGRAASSMSAPDWRAAVVYQAAEPAWWEDTAGAHFANAFPAFMDSTLAALGLSPALLDTEITRLSTGERQRLALVRSLARRPRVLLLDEPTAALDPDAVARVEALLRDRLADGMAVLVVTHAMEQARRLAQRIFRLEHGKLTTT